MSLTILHVTGFQCCFQCCSLCSILLATPCTSNTIHHIGILGIKLDLACNGGFCEGRPWKVFACEKMPLMKPRVQASSSFLRRIRMQSFVSDSWMGELMKPVAGFINRPTQLEPRFEQLDFWLVEIIIQRHVPIRPFGERARALCHEQRLVTKPMYYLSIFSSIPLKYKRFSFRFPVTSGKSYPPYSRLIGPQQTSHWASYDPRTNKQDISWTPTQPLLWI